MRWVWAGLFLMAVALGSFLVWQMDPSLRGGPQGQRSNLRTFDMSPRNDGGGTPEGTVLAHFGNSPDFKLTERSGGTFSKSDLAGKPWIADFIFTSCAGQCPLMSLQMKKFQAGLPSETGFHFASFTVDPERDTPEVLAQYADRYGAEKKRWLFLTGSKEEMNRILKEFFLSPVEQPAMHSTRFILVDGGGGIRGYYDSSDPGSMDQLMHDAQLVIARSQ